MKTFKKHEKEIIYYADDDADFIVVTIYNWNLFFFLLNNIKIFKCDSLQLSIKPEQIKWDGIKKLSELTCKRSLICILWSLSVKGWIAHRSYSHPTLILVDKSDSNILSNAFKCDLD